jgi:hypothetical protein
VSEKLLATTLTGAIAVETIGAVDPFGGKVKLPSPRQYLATLVLWFVLGLAASVGPRTARAAGQLSVLVLLTMLLGKYRSKFLALLEGASDVAGAGA